MLNKNFWNFIAQHSIYLPMNQLQVSRYRWFSKYLSVCGSTALVDLGRFFSFLICTQSVGVHGRGISLSQGRYLHTEEQTQNKCTQTSMPWVGFEPTIPVFEDCAATMISIFKIYNPQKLTKGGLRIYVIADSTNGYVFGLIPCYGSTTTKKFDAPRANIYQQNFSRTRKQYSKHNTWKEISFVYRQVLC
jgi:hypothetical protein